MGLGSAGLRTSNAEKKTSQELADMIQTEINVARTFIQVHPDKVYGSHPTVVAAPQNAHALQKGGRNNRHSVAR